MKVVKLSRKVKLRLALGVPAVLTLGVLAITHLVGAAGDGRIFTDVLQIPPKRVALVLGTSPKIASGAKNLYFVRRMEAAATLYKAGKVEKLLVSGDNGEIYYNEPTAMKKALIERGVPADAIACDYAGFRTLDSVVRAKEVFGVSDLTIVTDDFHLPRALYIAQEKGLRAVGFQTKPLPMSTSPRTHFREFGARLLIWMECNITHRQPKFLGPREPI